MARRIAACLALLAATALVHAREEPERPQLIVEAGSGSGIRGVRFSHDGRLIATTTTFSPRRLVVRETATGKALVAGLIPGGRSVSMEFDRTGRWLAFGCGGRVHLMDVRTGRIVHELTHDTDTWPYKEDEIALTFSPDGTRLATGGLRRICTWDVKSGARKAAWKTSDKAQRSILHLAWSGGDRQIASVRGGTAVVELRDDSGELVKTVATVRLAALATGPGGRALALGVDGQKVTLHDIASGSRHVLFTAGERIGSAAFSPDGRWVAVLDRKDLRIFDTTTRNEVRRLPGRTFVSELAMASDGRRVALARSDRLELRDATEDKALWAAASPARLVREVAVSRDGRRMALRTRDRALLFAIDGGRLDALDAVSPYGTMYGFECMALSQDGSYAAFGARGAVMLYAVESRHREWTFRGPPFDRADVQQVAFSPDGSKIVASDTDGRVAVWDVASRRLLVAYSQKHPSMLFPAAFSADSRELLLALGKKVLVFDVESRKAELSPLRTATMPTWVDRIDVLPGGRRMALTSTWGKGRSPPGVTRIVDVKTLDVVKSLDGHTGAAVSPDGRRLLTTHADGVHLFETDAWTQVARHPRTAGFAFTANSRVVAEWGADVWRWTPETGHGVRFRDPVSWKLLATLTWMPGRDWVLATPDGVFDATAEALKRTTWRRIGRVALDPIETHFNDYFLPTLWSEVRAGRRPPPPDTYGRATPRGRPAPSTPPEEDRKPAPPFLVQAKGKTYPLTFDTGERKVRSVLMAPGGEWIAVDSEFNRSTIVTQLFGLGVRAGQRLTLRHGHAPWAVSSDGSSLVLTYLRRGISISRGGEPGITHALLIADPAEPSARPRHVVRLDSAPKQVFVIGAHAVAVDKGGRARFFHLESGVEDPKRAADWKGLLIDYNARRDLLAKADAEQLTIEDAGTGRVLIRSALPEFDRVTRVAFSPSGETLAVVRAPKRFERTTPRLLLLSVKADRLFTDLAVDEVEFLRFLPDNRMLTRRRGVTRVRDSRGRILRELPRGVGDVHIAPGSDLALDVKGAVVTLRDGDTFAPRGYWLPVSSPDTAYPLAVTRKGLFDGHPNTWKTFAVRSDEGSGSSMRGDVIAERCFEPGVLGALLKGGAPDPERSFADLDRRRPTVVLKRAPGDQLFSRQYVDLEIRVPDAPAGARDLRLFRNGVLVKRWRGAIAPGDRALTARVPVVSGKNRFVSYAFNQDGVKSEDATLVHEAIFETPARTAVIVAFGVDDYVTDEVSDLRYAASDANAFTEGLKRALRQTGDWDDVRTLVLENEQVSRATILGALGKLAGGEPRGADDPALEEAGLSPTGPHDAVIVFFSGHGQARDERFHLFPHDVDVGADGALGRTVSDADLEAVLESVDARHILLVIDSCQSGRALGEADARLGPLNARGLGQLAFEKGIHVLVASQAEQSAYEASRYGHGLLTYALVKEGLPDELEGGLDVPTWLERAAERVPALHADVLTGKGPRRRRRHRDPRLVQRPRVYTPTEPAISPMVVVPAETPTTEAPRVIDKALVARAGKIDYWALEAGRERTTALALLTDPRVTEKERARLALWLSHALERRHHYLTDAGKWTIPRALPRFLPVAPRADRVVDGVLTAIGEEKQGTRIVLENKGTSEVRIRIAGDDRSRWFLVPSKGRTAVTTWGDYLAITGPGPAYKTRVVRVERKKRYAFTVGGAR